MPEFEFEGKRPRVHPEAWVAPTAVLVGDVEIGAGATVWFGAVIRGDESSITVGAGTNIQDNAVIHCSRDKPTRIGERAMLAAGSVLPEGREVPAGHLAAGTPAEVKKQLSGSSADWVERTAGHYQRAGAAYREGLVGVDRD